MKVFLKILIGVIPVSLTILFSIGLATGNIYAVVFMGSFSIFALLLCCWAFGDFILYEMKKGGKR